MKKLYSVLLLLLLATGASAQFSKWERFYTTRHPRTGITIANPLSSMSKSGGGVEHRLGNFSYMAGYYTYRGAYPGLMTDLDLRFYRRKCWKHRTKPWMYQDFYYFRSFVGIAGFNSDKLTFMGYDKGITWYEKGYVGSAAGWGRRYSTIYNHGKDLSRKIGLFGAIKVGGRYTSFALDPIEPEARQYYRLFYTTGPGSILEVNMSVGIEY